MKSSEIIRLLDDVKIIVKDAIKILIESNSKELIQYSYLQENEREMKSKVDNIMNQVILNRLKKNGISILSEESGVSERNTDSTYRFIVDPLDGTVTFVRGVGPSAISIALYNGDTPIFGVIGNTSSQDIIWGGKKIGSFLGSKKINVSDIEILNESIICTGFPSRFDTSNKKKLFDYYNFMSTFGKVRMIGAASISLMYVAKGSAEYYLENNIMLWDVAAGLAIVEGAGGTVFYKKGDFKNSLNVHASNGKITL